MASCASADSQDTSEFSGGSASGEHSEETVVSKIEKLDDGDW